MTEPARVRGRARSRLAGGWGMGARCGLVALGVVVGVAEAAALAVAALGGTGLSAWGAVRVGGFYVAAFHRVPLRLSAEGLDVAGLSSAIGGTASSADLSAELAVAPLLGTALALWLLWRGARAVAEREGGSALERAIHGLKVVPVYALGVAVVSWGSAFRVPIDGSLVSGTIRLAPAAVPALVLPLALGAIAAGAGGWWSVPAPQAGAARAARGVLAGAWTMLVAGLGLAYAGLFLAGVVRPDGPEALLTPSTGRYFQVVFERPAAGMVVLAHHVSLAPNEAAWVLTPAMGGCTGAFTAEREAEPFLCYRRYPLDVALPAWLAPPRSAAGPVPTTRFGAAPGSYLLFLLVPAAATWLGGRRATRTAEPRTAGRAASLGAGGGAVFAGLLTAVAWLASLGASGTLALDGRTAWDGAARLGPDLVQTFAFALAWGAVGGALGSVWAQRPRRASRSTGAG